MMNTRKLFQNTNQPTDCVYFCDETCPYACYPDVDLDYYIPPPPPPSSPPPPSKHHQNISPYIIISVALFASLFLLVSYYLIIVKNCFSWNRRRSTQLPPQDEEFFDENRAPVIDHPIWYINTTGLHPSVIDKISIFKYKRGDGIMVEGTNCSVCLNEFQDDESLRLLPICKHAFHIHCIDTWLRSHINCPLCRSVIMFNTFNPVVPIEANSGTSLSINEESLLVNDEQREVNSSNNNEVMESEFQDNQEECLQMGTIRKEVASKRGCLDGEVQSMRRSVSVDSSISSSRGLDDIFVLSRMSEVGEAVGENSSSTMHKEEEPVLMKRAFSYGGRSFFLRHNRSRSSVLPL